MERNLFAQAAPVNKKSWEEPTIILERPLEVAAQEGPTDDKFVEPGPWRLPGPLAASGGAGFCE
jgi:hypothetical protein